ncbi:MAG: ATP-binding protein [Planctomycetales bacterium]
MQDYEKLGVFYLGKHYDADARQPREEKLLYESKALTTHGVCVGMTGSGKTGLCLSLLEEAAIDGIPAIAIDPKGDLGNLLLTFPELQPRDFQPWIDPADAARQGLSPEQLAEKTAAQWRAGLEAWDQPIDRIARFRDSADIAVYTPGSGAGLPLSILNSFEAPPADALSDTDALRERIGAAVSSLLALLGIDADPLRSREHVLLSSLFDRAWREGRDLDLAGLVREIQHPPFDKIGVLDLEATFPAKERVALSMTLNNLLASPGFAGWREGEPLDIARLLHTPQGKPRLSIISIAHLSDAERMFFVTVLLNEVISWMRKQSGTSSLRALLYMDEVFGYFPPTANPPSKTPMLTLLKQARAYGLGVMLATQNPVDLDYKGLSNAGTWFIGRLQTERDKARVLDGLEGASTAAGVAFRRAEMEQIISGLGNRVFLVNNVHADQPAVMQTRWLLSYLRGPLTRDQIQALMAPRKVGAPAAAAAAVAGQSGPTRGATAGQTQRPLVPPGIPELFVPRRRELPAGGKLLYRPLLVGTARVHFTQARSGTDVWESLMVRDEVSGTGTAEAWTGADVATDEEPEWESAPEGDAGLFAPLPSELTQPKTFSRLATQLKDHLYRHRVLTLWHCPDQKETSRGGEMEGDFRARLSLAAREQRDAQVEKLRTKYATKFAALEERRRKALQKVDKQKSQAGEQSMHSWISMASSVAGALFGRKLASAANVNRAATAARAASKIGRSKQEVEQAEENVALIDEQLNELNRQLQSEVDELEVSTRPDSIQLEVVEIKPKKADIKVTRVALAWIPWIVTAAGDEEPAD